MTTPAGPHGTAFSVFDGELVAGIWRLWINDDLGGDGGTVADGQLGIQTDFLPPLMSIDTPTSAATFTSTQMFLTVGGEIEDLVGSWAVRWRNVVDGAYYESGAMRLVAPPSDVFEGSVPLRRGTNVITVTGKNVGGDEVTDTLTVTVSEFGYYLSEGATGGFFDTSIDVLKLGPATAGIEFSYLPETGPPVTHSTRGSSPPVLRIDAEDHVAGGGFSTVVRSTNAYPLAIERNMFWDDTKYGGHGGTAVDAAEHALAVRRRGAGLLRHLRAARQRQRLGGDRHRPLPPRERRPGGDHAEPPAAQPHDDLGRRRRRRSRARRSGST